MTYEHICTVCKTSTKHISDLTAEMLHIYTPYILMEVYGIPADWDEEKIDAAIDDTVSGIPLGRVEGYLVLGAAIERSGEDLYECCDSTSEELENAVSALMEKNGPLKYAMNLFHITELNVKDPEAVEILLEELPAMIFTHMNVFPDIISFNPAPLPHEPSKLEQIQRDLAMIAYNEANKKLEKQIFGDGEPDEDEEEDAPQLTLSPEQLNIAMGKRNEGESYSEEYIDKEAWQPFLDAGYEEWRRTRVLYKIVD